MCDTVKEHNIRVYPIFTYDKEHETHNEFLITLANITGGQNLVVYKLDFPRTIFGLLYNIFGGDFDFPCRTKTLELPDDFDPEKVFMKNSEKYNGIFKEITTEINVIKDIRINIEDLEDKFQSDIEYQNLVFSIFRGIINRNNDDIFLLRYNTLLKKFWKLIWHEKENIGWKPLMQSLKRRISEATDIEDVIFMENLFYNTDEQVKINNKLIQGYLYMGPFYVIDLNMQFKRNNTYQLAKFCKSENIITIIEMFRGLNIYTNIPNIYEKGGFMSVHMLPEVKFKLLPHIVFPGTQLSMREDLILAAVAVVHNFILRCDAIKFLQQYRGKWIDFNLAPNNTLGFIRLMISVAKYAVNDNELRQLHALNKIVSLKSMKNKTIEVEISYTSTKTLRPDDKKKCNNCNQWRSLTLMNDKVCILCLDDMQNKDFIEDDDRSFSYMCECTNCLVHYAINCFQKLTRQPLCHFCRNNMEPVPFVQCVNCLNKFLRPGKNYDEVDYTCKVCENKEYITSQRYRISIGRYVQENKPRFIGVNIKYYTRIFSPEFDVSKLTDDERLKIVPLDSEETSEPLFIKIGNGEKKILNEEEIKQKIRNILNVTEINSETHQCKVCFKNYPKIKILNIKGHKENQFNIQLCMYCLKQYRRLLAEHDRKTIKQYPHEKPPMTDPIFMSFTNIARDINIPVRLSNKYRCFRDYDFARCTRCHKFKSVWKIMSTKYYGNEKNIQFLCYDCI